MVWLERLEQALLYIEQHLEREISLEELGKIACCSPFHFQRMFSYLAEMPLSLYIRRRRMTLAAFDLQKGGKVLDIALKYGYDSPTSFARAFQSVHGVPPSHAKAKGSQLKAYPRIHFQIQIKGDTEMNYRIEQKEAFRIVGKKITLPAEGAEASSPQAIPAFWGETASLIPKLCALNDTAPNAILGVCTPPGEATFDYYIAAASSLPLPQGMEEYAIGAHTWAIFQCVGPMPGAMQEMQKRVLTEWLPSSGYDYADAPDIELYTPGDQSAPDYRSEVWLPVKKQETR